MIGQYAARTESETTAGRSEENFTVSDIHKQSMISAERQFI